MPAMLPGVSPGAVSGTVADGVVCVGSTAYTGQDVFKTAGLIGVVDGLECGTGNSCGGVGVSDF